MVQYSDVQFDRSFAALADVTRRGVLVQLGRCERSVGELASAFGMTLTGMKKHIGVLEDAGLVETEKLGRVRMCRLGAKRLEAERQLLADYQALWASRFAGLDKVVAELKRKETGRDRQTD
jgi:DNA-binding transcriptional ArsR family regulator